MRSTPPLPLPLSARSPSSRGHPQRAPATSHRHHYDGGTCFHHAADAPQGRARRSRRIARHLRDHHVRPGADAARGDLADSRGDEVGLQLEEERLRNASASAALRGGNRHDGSQPPRLCRSRRHAASCWPALGAQPQRQGERHLRIRPGMARQPIRFALEPALTLGKGPHHTAAGRQIFGAIGDSAPDRWGRVLIQREERRKAREESARRARCSSRLPARRRRHRPPGRVALRRT